MVAIAERLAHAVIHNGTSKNPKTRAALARELGINEVYAHVRAPQTQVYKAVISKYARKFSAPLDKALKALNEKDFTQEKAVALAQISDTLNKHRRLESDLSTGSETNLTVFMQSVENIIDNSEGVL